MRPFDRHSSYALGATATPLGTVTLSSYSIGLCISSLQQLSLSFIGFILALSQGRSSQHTTSGRSRFSSFPLSSASVVPEHLLTHASGTVPGASMANTYVVRLYRSVGATSLTTRHAP
jgi:hypothetical protein